MEINTFLKYFESNDEFYIAVLKYFNDNFVIKDIDVYEFCDTLDKAEFNKDTNEYIYVMLPFSAMFVHPLVSSTYNIYLFDELIYTNTISSRVYNYGFFHFSKILSPTPSNLIISFFGLKIKIK